jgi:hypothetical protein
MFYAIYHSAEIITENGVGIFKIKYKLNNS